MGKRTVLLAILLLVPTMLYGSSYTPTQDSLIIKEGRVLDVRGKAVVDTLRADSLTVNGPARITGTLFGANGTAAAPGFAFGNDPNTGLVRLGADTLGIVTNGTTAVTVLPSGYVGMGATPAAKLQVETAANAQGVTLGLSSGSMADEAYVSLGFRIRNSGGGGITNDATDSRGAAIYGIATGSNAGDLAFLTTPNTSG